MLVPVTILLPQEVANVLQRSENSSSKKFPAKTKDFGKVFQITPVISKITPVPTQTMIQKPVERTAANYNFTPRLLGGRTASQLFFDIEEQQNNLCQVLSFDLARVSTPNASQANKPAVRAQPVKAIPRKNKQVVKKPFGRKNQVGKIQKVQKVKSQKKNIRQAFVPRLFGKRTPSQLFFMAQFQENTDQTKDQAPEEPFVPRLFGKRTPSQLFFMNRFQEIRAAPEASFEQKQKLKAKRDAAKNNQFVPRLFGKRTSSQLFQVSKILRRQAQLDYKPKSKGSIQQKTKFVPRLFGQRTPSQLFLQINANVKTYKSKQIKKSATAQKRSANYPTPVYGTTGQHGYLTPSRLMNPYRIKREKYYTLGKGRKTPSALHLAYIRQHKNRSNLFGALTASQLLTVAIREANRSRNARQVEDFSSSPTISQLGLNRRSSKSKTKPVAQPSSKLLKHLNQLPMEKSKKTDDALTGLTSSQLFLLADKKLKPQTKKTKQSQNVYFNQKTSRAKEEAEKSKLRPLLYGL